MVAATKPPPSSTEKERYYVQFDTPAQCLWPPSNFDKNEEATRMGINFEPTDEII